MFPIYSVNIYPISVLYADNTKDMQQHIQYCITGNSSDRKYLRILSLQAPELEGTNDTNITTCTAPTTHSPMLGKAMIYGRKLDNTEDRYAVAMLKDKDIIGHILKMFFSWFHIYYNRWHIPKHNYWYYDL